MGLGKIGGQGRGMLFICKVQKGLGERGTTLRLSGKSLLLNNQPFFRLSSLPCRACTPLGLQVTSFEGRSSNDLQVTD